MRNMFRIAFLILPTLVFADSVSFDRAKMLADKSENSIESNEMSMLVKAQGALVSTAFPQCMNTTKSPPTNFTVVVELDSNGKVRNSWLNGTSSFAKCFHETMVERFFYKPPFMPFYTAFEYTNTQ